LNRWREKRLEVATHEAGHALVALTLGLEVRLATILDGRLGPARIELVGEDAGTLEARAMVRLAGRQALVAFGQLDPSTELGCRKDLEEARAYAVAIAGGDEGAGAVLDELRTKVDDLIFEHHLALGQISIELLKCWTLTGAELLEIATNEPNRSRRAVPFGGAAGAAGPGVCHQRAPGPLIEGVPLCRS
jgi:hypothetical protein